MDAVPSSLNKFGLNMTMVSRGARNSINGDLSCVAHIEKHLADLCLLFRKVGEFPRL